MAQLVFSDVDGVLTDSKINISESGELFKSFNVKDGLGIVRWVQKENQHFVIVTSRESKAVTKRALELGIEEVYQNVDDKERKIREIASRLGVDLEDTAYIGDDLTDIEALRVAGTACCPANAVQKVKAECEYVSSNSGGEAAVRDILNHLSKTSGTAVGVIPARYGSTRLPGKPLVDIDGKPMIQHVYERADEAELLDDVIVATDDERIEKTIESFGGSAMMTSPDHSTGTDRVAEVARNVSSDLIINIQGDEPLIDPDIIDDVVRSLREYQPGVATPISTISQESLLDDKNTIKVVIDNDGRALYFSRSKVPFGGQTGEVYKHIGLYGFEKGLLLDYVEMNSKLEAIEDLEQLRLLENGYEIQTVQTNYDSKEVNIESDIQVVEQELQHENDSENL